MVGWGVKVLNFLHGNRITLGGQSLKSEQDSPAFCKKVFDQWEVREVCLFLLCGPEEGEMFKVGSGKFSGHSWHTMQWEKAVSPFKFQLFGFLKAPNVRVCLECFSRVFGQGLEGSMVSLSLRKGHFTWLHLGSSARLKIWQVPACKMEPQSGIISCKNPIH